MKSLYQFEMISISGKEIQHPCTDSFVFVCFHCELSLVHAHIFSAYITAPFFIFHAKCLAQW